MTRAKRLSTMLLWSALAASTLHAQKAYDLTGDFWGTHDPSIAKQGNTWYVFATGKTREGGEFAIRCSTDLIDWHLCGQVFDSIPAWIHEASPATPDLWAPDISFYKGEYRLYYAYSLFGKNTSGIALATNKTLDPKSPGYKWVDHGLVLQSGVSDDYNAIDPCFIVDEQGRSWLAFGSFWSGIKLRRLNDEGKLSTEDIRFYGIATREKRALNGPAHPGVPPDWEAVEAPFIVHHSTYYYLFVSWDLCCKGTDSNYKTMVGRAADIKGPYLDQAGKSMMLGGGTQILFPNSEWLGPGGESIFLGKPDLIVYHAYDGVSGKPALQISTIDWTSGWPHVALEPHHGPAPAKR